MAQEFTIKDLDALLSLRSSGLEGIAKAQKNRQEQNVKTIDALNNVIKESVTPEAITYNRVLLESTKPLVTDNPQAFLKHIEGQNLQQETEQDAQNYYGYMDKSRRLLAKTSGLSDEDKVDYYNNITIDEIREELDFIDNMEAVIYDNPFEETKKQKNFVGHYSKGGMTDIEIIKKTYGYRGELQAALFAMNSEGSIGDHEMPFVLGGDKKTLETLATENIKDGKSNMNRYESSMKSIRSFKKSLYNIIASNNLKDDDKFSVSFLDSKEFEKAIEAKLQTDYENNPEFFENKSLDEVLDNQVADMSELSTTDVLDIWDNEILKLELLMKQEATRIYKWGGGEFKLGKGYIDEYKKKKQDEAMKKKEVLTLPEVKELMKSSSESLKSTLLKPQRKTSIFK